MNFKKIIFLNLKLSQIEPMFELHRFQTPNNDGIWKNIQAVTKIEEADYYIVVEKPPKEIGFDKLNCSKIIYFQCEPSSIHNSMKSILKKYKDQFFAYFDYDNYRHIPFWYSRIPFKELQSLPYKKKNKQLSCLMSNKQFKHVPGHNLRLEYLKKFAEKYPNEIDIYGRNMPIKGPYKGELDYNWLCTSKAFTDYHYTFLCENTNEKGQLSERINDCLLNWSMPIYHGGSDIYDWFPEEALHTVDIMKDDIERVYRISQQPVSDLQIQAIEKSRQLIMYEHNIFEKIHRILI